MQRVGVKRLGAAAILAPFVLIACVKQPTLEFSEGDTKKRQSIVTNNATEIKPIKSFALAEWLRNNGYAELSDRMPEKLDIALDTTASWQWVAADPDRVMHLIRDGSLVRSVPPWARGTDKMGWGSFVVGKIIREPIYLSSDFRSQCITVGRDDMLGEDDNIILCQFRLRPGLYGRIGLPSTLKGMIPQFHAALKDSVMNQAETETN